jgi:hypothetical protein
MTTTQDDAPLHVLLRRDQVEWLRRVVPLALGEHDIMPGDIGESTLTALLAALASDLPDEPRPGETRDALTTKDVPQGPPTITSPPEVPKTDEGGTPEGWKGKPKEWDQGGDSRDV